MQEYEARAPSPRLPGGGGPSIWPARWRCWSPGRPAGGLVVTDEQGRSLARRAQYLGPSTRLDATARALLDGLLLAVSGGLEQPLIRLDDAALVDALRGTAEFRPAWETCQRNSVLRPHNSRPGGRVHSAPALTPLAP